MNARGSMGNFADILNIDLRSRDCQIKARTTEDIEKDTEQDLISLKIIHRRTAKLFLGKTTFFLLCLGP